MNKQPIMGIMLVVGIGGCKPEYVEQEPTEVPTTGYGDTGDTGDTEGNPSVCFPEEADPGAVRWQCEGFAEAALHFTMSEGAVLPDSVPDDWRAYIQAILDYGRLDWYE